MNEYEKFCKNFLIDKFNDLGVEIPEEESQWIPTLEDVLDTDVAAMIAIAAVRAGVDMRGA